LADDTPVTLPYDARMTDAAEQLLAAYPSLASIPAARFAETAARLPVISVETGTELFAEGQACQGFPCVLSGQVRVARGSVDGRELELYRVGPGEVCVVSAGCLFGALALTAHGHASMPTRLVLVDRDTLLEWSDARPWRLFLLGLMAERLAELTTLVEAVAFQRLDQRLARSLLGHGPAVQTTHQKLADELGTAREIVSRLLGRFEDQGIVRLGRERIEIVDLTALRQLAGGL
jgi:CRP/FNR family transcriptional regulator